MHMPLALVEFSLYIYLAVLGLSCSRWDLQSSLWHVVI